MKITPAHYTDLPSHEDRTVAHFAAKARCNTLFGGASALALAERAERMGSRNSPRSVVSAVYSRSTGKHDRELEGWCCDECGQAWLGYDAAAQCCYVDPFGYTDQA